MPPSTRIRKASTVSLPAGAPLPPPGAVVHLSAFDVYWLPLQPVSRLFLFPAPGSPSSFPAIAGALRSSLARILPSFHPLAGTLSCPASSEAVVIVCSGGSGVLFLEAETDLVFENLANDEKHDVEAFRQLVPDIRREELPAPVMAVQVTEFVPGGGVAVGVALHHAAADGRGLWQFIEAWAAPAAAQAEGGAARPPPLHDRRLVQFEGSEELASLFLRQVAPDLPRTDRKQDSVPERRPLGRRTFTFTASAVRSLKQRVAPANAGKAPSTFAALAAHGWVSLARASGFADDGPVHAVFVADCRPLLSPPVDDAYVGNCLGLCAPKLSGSELTGPGGLARAFLAIGEAVRAVKEAPLRDNVQWVTMFSTIPPGRAVVLAGSPWFPAYEVDFGWGRPARTELVSMNHDGEMVLVAGREAGSVQASVAIAADKMMVFSEVFVDAGHGQCSVNVGA